MTTDPKKSLASTSISELAKNDVDRLLQTGLADFSLRELLGLLISSAGAAERSVYLEKEPTDKPNGFYDRSLQLGTIPVDVRVPRTRTGEFRPALFLQRGGPIGHDEHWFGRLLLDAHRPLESGHPC